MDYYHHYSVLWIAGWIPENLQWLLHELMTNGDCIPVRWISQYLANWWKCHIWSVFPHTNPIQGLNPVFSRPLPFGDWLTSDGWLADGSRCTHGTSSAWFHNVSLPPSSLVNIRYRVGVFKGGSNVNSSSSSYLNIFTFDFFGEFDPVRVGEWTRLLIDVVDVEHFTHELNDRLGLVKGSGRHYKDRKTIKSLFTILTIIIAITVSSIATTIVVQRGKRQTSQPL